VDKRQQQIGKYFDRFDLVFIVTIITLALLLLVDLNAEGLVGILSVVVTILNGVTLLLAFLAAGVSMRWYRVARIIVILTVLLAIAALFMPEAVQNRGGFLWLIIAIAAPLVMLKRLVRHEKVTGMTVLGAVGVFLLMGISATYLFLFIDMVTGTSGVFFGTQESTTVFTYFSLVTLTTLGYGDFSPVGVFGRAAAAWLAIIGQIYLVVIVARMVAMFSDTMREERKAKKATEE
jgi:hypothetical protein